ncbi:peptidylprolyl isomerase ['Paenibacillus yunnanensis' Narsing Rao et al. 2020]|uniref:peptidylprolyl isomerase n=1 Tax=Paenibacillus tengchongensis TaxID=2608684 RepID=UPI00124C8CDA|nr:peptidylprolyl isomerase [Paenibacillus tengchongensis]
MKLASITLAQGQEIRLELYGLDAPGTVANFESLANSGFYNGLKFQRVVRGFVAQGGCPDGNGRGGTAKIPCETQNNPHKHVRGALSMAHFGPNTGSCQFFICYDTFEYLDGWHTVFGRVTEGMEQVDALRRGDIIKEVKVWDQPVVV